MPRTKHLNASRLQLAAQAGAPADCATRCHGVYAPRTHPGRLETMYQAMLQTNTALIRAAFDSTHGH